MIPIWRTAWKIVDQLTRMALGLVGLMTVIAVMAPIREADDSARPIPERPADVVALAVPAGQAAKSLTITDVAGSELATLTLWHDGASAVTLLRDGGPRLGVWLKKRRTSLELIGTKWRYLVVMEPDGGVRVSKIDSVTGP